MTLNEMAYARGTKVAAQMFGVSPPPAPPRMPGITPIGAANTKPPGLPTAAGAMPAPIGMPAAAGGGALPGVDGLQKAPMLGTGITPSAGSPASAGHTSAQTAATLGAAAVSKGGAGS